MENGSWRTAMSLKKNLMPIISLILSNTLSVYNFQSSNVFFS